LEAVAAKFPAGGARCTVRKGNAAEVIIESAAAEKQTVIAMATHGRSGVKRWMLGSVTETVVRHSDDPVFVVRAH
jgi:nucleotide-binding universal stress UspA family protein